MPDVILLAAIWISFFVSASAGLGGSLVLVPVLTLALGAKNGVAMAALFLAANNIVKLWVYRDALPVRSAAGVALCTVAGAFLGSRLLVAAPAALVDAAVVTSIGVALLMERRKALAVRLSLVPGLAFAAGATSGFTGTSGPLKGVAIRSLGLDRLHTVGAAAIVSLTADATKAAVFAQAGLIDGGTVPLALAAIPLMVTGTLAGRRVLDLVGERGYAGLFWLIIGGYSARLLLQIP
jgi:uncharacterized protein